MLLRSTALPVPPPHRHLHTFTLFHPPGSFHAQLLLHTPLATQSKSPPGLPIHSAAAPFLAREHHSQALHHHTVNRHTHITEAECHRKYTISLPVAATSSLYEGVYTTVWAVLKARPFAYTVIDGLSPVLCPVSSRVSQFTVAIAILEKCARTSSSTTVHYSTHTFWLTHAFQLQRKL